MSTTDKKYSNRSEHRYGLNFIQTRAYCTMEGGETHMDGGRLTEVYKSLKVEKIKIDYSLNTVDAITYKHQTTQLK